MRTKEFDITDPKIPFKDCLLKRESFANILTGLISEMKDGGVISLNNEWGTGKSTFLKMWKQQLLNEGYITLEFNAWENDYEDNPLVPIISEIKDNIGEKDSKSFARIIEVGGKLLIEGGAMMAKKALGSIVGEGGADKLVDVAIGQAEEILKEEINLYKQKKDSLNEFKKLLGGYLASEIDNQKLPLVFIIDELDRCRPDYAVRVLESVKHIFSVPNIVFIVSIDKTQLKHSINGFYGSENINSEEYLRRFFDLEISLPVPNKDGFIKTLITSKGVNNYFPKDSGESKSQVCYDLLLLILNQRTLRQIEKFITYLQVVLQSKQINYPSFKLFVFLMHLKLYKSVEYNNVREKKLSMNQIAELFAKDSVISGVRFLENDFLKIVELHFGVSYNSMLQKNYEDWNLMYYNHKEPESTFKYKSLINEKFEQDLLDFDKRPLSILDLDQLMNLIDMIY